MSKRINTLFVKEAKDTRTTTPHNLPIYATSSFTLENVAEAMDIFKDPSKGHLYSRFSNPTIDTVANKIAKLEAFGSDITDAWGVMTSSGMSAISTVIMAELSAGDKILTQGNLYGGSTQLIGDTMPKYGIHPVFTNLTDLNRVKEALSEDKDIKMVYFETPSNPSLDCIDMTGLSALAKEYDVVTVVDNSFCSPAVQRPMMFGIDYVVHSTTKYINGHGNSISGIVVGSGAEARSKVWSTMKAIGMNCNPWDAWLANNGMKTLGLRMERHSSNALALAEFLQNHPMVANVNYLGLPDHRYHDLAKRQMKGFSGMLSFEVAGDLKAGMNFIDACKIGSLAPTMGDVDTLIMHPASMSHLRVDRALRLENGITDALIRISVGIEDIEDLKEGFDAALNA